jgi:RNA polymerase sigma-70 factor (ECF subfamily)
LTGLKTEQQKCIQLFFLENKSYVEIAEILNLSLNAVKSAIQNGKRMLKVKLENNGFKLNEI